MKKVLFHVLFAVAWLFPRIALAQAEVQTSANVVLTAKSTEIFVVYVDGIPCGNISYDHTQQQVALANLPSGVHEITVRLIRPIDRIAHLTIDYQQQTLSYSVYYNATTQAVSVLTEPGLALPATAAPTTPTVPPTPAIPHAMPPAGPSHVATEADILGIVDRMKKTTFENDKLQLAKSFVKGKHVGTAQAIRIAQVIRFESKRLDFLLYAYDCCYDRENYYKAADILNFSNNKKKLLKRIQHSSPHRGLHPHRRKAQLETH